MSEHTIADSVGVNTGFVAGKAYLNAICDIEHGNSVSIVSDRGDFQCVKVATHELAHRYSYTHALTHAHRYPQTHTDTHTHTHRRRG